MIVISVNDVVFQSSLYYNNIYRLYQNIVTEYGTGFPMNRTLAPTRQLLHDRFPSDDPEINRRIDRIFDLYAKEFAMGIFFDTAVALHKLPGEKAFLFLGDPELYTATIMQHGLESAGKILHLPMITPTSITELYQANGFTAQDTLFIGSSPARDLNPVLTAQLPCIRVYYPNYVMYDEQLYKPVKEFSTLYECATYLNGE